MIIYSRKIIHFAKEIKYKIKEFLSSEVRLKVAGDRFYDRMQKASYPIKVVIYNNKSMLGYFDPNFYELGFHECLMNLEKSQLHNVIRHEIAHYMTFVEFGEGILSHGIEFRSFCERMGWGEEVYRATLCMENNQNTASEIPESSVLRKIQKLMALAGSSNKNEAEQAMIKSQQLLLKYNIESKHIGEASEEKIYLKRILKQKKENAKMRAIAKILETFFVSTVYHRAGGFIYLEILGNQVNVEIAEYVANFLLYELDKFWDQATKLANLKGTIARNSFFLGLAKGYCNKIQALKREYTSETSNALMIIENKLEQAREMAYPRLSSAKSSGSHCQKSSVFGEMMGKQLNINPAIKHSSFTSNLFIE